MRKWVPVRRQDAYAKANPGRLKWGSQGFGTAPHLLIQLFKLENSVNIVHVPYRGAAPLLNAILGGEVQIIADASTTSLPHVEAGKLRPIAITGTTRAPKLLQVPTVVEAGFPYLVASFWLAVTAPAATPRPIIDKPQHGVPRGARRAGNACAARHV